MTDQILEAETLETLAVKIVQYSNEADARVIEAAKLVLEARERVEKREAGDITWYEWARKNIKLSGSRLRELQRISEAEDPKAELERIRVQGRKRQAQHRDKKKPAPLRNGGDTDGQAAQLDPKREQLIEFVQSAPLSHIEKLLSLAQELAAKNGATASDQAVEHVGDADLGDAGPESAGLQLAAE